MPSVQRAVCANPIFCEFSPPRCFSLGLSQLGSLPSKMDCGAQTLLFAIDGILSLVDSMVAIEPSIMIGSGIFRCSLNMVFRWSKTEQVDAATYLAYNRNFKSSWAFNKLVPDAWFQLVHFTLQLVLPWWTSVYKRHSPFYDKFTSPFFLTLPDKNHCHRWCWTVTHLQW